MSSTILHKYFREYGAMLTYSNLRDLIFNGETSTQIMSTTQVPTTTAIKKSSTKRGSAKKSIPIHTNVGMLYDPTVAEKFECESRVLIAPNDEITL